MRINNYREWNYKTEIIRFEPNNIYDFSKANLCNHLGVPELFAQHNILQPCIVLVLYMYQSVNTLRPRPNGRHFGDDTCKRIFLKENARIAMKISLKFVPKKQQYSSIGWDYGLAPTSHFLSQWWLDYWRIYMRHSASMS